MQGHPAAKVPAPRASTKPHLLHSHLRHPHLGSGAAPGRCSRVPAGADRAGTVRPPHAAGSSPVAPPAAAPPPHFIQAHLRRELVFHGALQAVFFAAQLCHAGSPAATACSGAARVTQLRGKGWEAGTVWRVGVPARVWACGCVWASGACVSAGQGTWPATTALGALARRLAATQPRRRRCRLGQPPASPPRHHRRHIPVGIHESGRVRRRGRRAAHGRRGADRWRPLRHVPALDAGVHAGVPGAFPVPHPATGVLGCRNGGRSSLGVAERAAVIWPCGWSAGPQLRKAHPRRGRGPRQCSRRPRRSPSRYPRRSSGSWSSGVRPQGRPPPSQSAGTRMWWVPAHFTTLLGGAPELRWQEAAQIPWI